MEPKIKSPITIFRNLKNPEKSTTNFYLSPFLSPWQNLNTSFLF